MAQEGSSHSANAGESTPLSITYDTNITNKNGQSAVRGVSLEDYYKIFAVLTHIDDVDKVL